MGTINNGSLNCMSTSQQDWCTSTTKATRVTNSWVILWIQIPIKEEGPDIGTSILSYIFTCSVYKTHQSKEDTSFCCCPWCDDFFFATNHKHACSLYTNCIYKFISYFISLLHVYNRHFPIHLHNDIMKRVIGLCLNTPMQRLSWHFAFVWKSLAFSHHLSPSSSANTWSASPPSLKPTKTHHL